MVLSSLWEPLTLFGGVTETSVHFHMHASAHNDAACGHVGQLSYLAVEGILDRGLQ